MARIGSIPCPTHGCGNGDATVSKTGAGTLNISCHRCEQSSYAKAGTRAHRLITAHMTPDAEDAPPAKQADKPAPAARKATTLMG